MYITAHFTLEEMTVSQTAEREGLDNAPNAAVLASLHQLCQTLEQVRRLVGGPILVSSGYRSEQLNQRIGGSANSAHIQGLAADFITPALTPRQLAGCIEQSGLAFDQLILEYDRWVHLAIGRGRSRRQVLTLRRGTGYLPGIQ